MKFLIQKVKNLKIYKDNKIIINLDREDFYFLIYVGIEKRDENKNLEEIVKLITDLQIVDIKGKFSKTIKDIKPSIVFISQITLLSNFDKGRINFNQSLNFDLSRKIFNRFITVWRKLGYNVFSTDFGSFLEIESTNIGPVNFIFSC